MNLEAAVPYVAIGYAHLTFFIKSGTDISFSIDRLRKIKLKSHRSNPDREVLHAAFS